MRMSQLIYFITLLGVSMLWGFGIMETNPGNHELYLSIGSDHEKFPENQNIGQLIMPNLERNNYSKCTGTVIGEFVLTAAHCVRNHYPEKNPNLPILFGIKNKDGIEIIRVKEVFFPEFPQKVLKENEENLFYGNPEYDIAILKLQQRYRNEVPLYLNLDKIEGKQIIPSLVLGYGDSTPDFIIEDKSESDENKGPYYFFAKSIVNELNSSLKGFYTPIANYSEIGNMLYRYSICDEKKCAIEVSENIFIEVENEEDEEDDEDEVEKVLISLNLIDYHPNQKSSTNSDSLVIKLEKIEDVIGEVMGMLSYRYFDDEEIRKSLEYFELYPILGEIVPGDSGGPLFRAERENGVLKMYGIVSGSLEDIEEKNIISAFVSLSGHKEFIIKTFLENAEDEEFVEDFCERHSVESESCKVKRDSKFLKWLTWIFG